MREHAQLNLRVVRGDQPPAGLGDERRADAQAELVTDGNILQVGIGRGKPAGARHGLVETGVQAAGFRMDELGQRINVSGLELGARAVLDDLARQVVLLGERFEHRGFRGILAALLQALAAGELEFLKQDFAELLGRVDVEGPAGQVVDLARQRGQLLVELL